MATRIFVESLIVVIIRGCYYQVLKAEAFLQQDIVYYLDVVLSLCMENYFFPLLSFLSATLEVKETDSNAVVIDANFSELVFHFGLPLATIIKASTFLKLPFFHYYGFGKILEMN